MRLKLIFRYQDKSNELTRAEILKLAEVRHFCAQNCTLSEQKSFFQKLWTTFYPQGPSLDHEGRAVCSFTSFPWMYDKEICDLLRQLLASEIIKAVDEDGNTAISFDEFVPWYLFSRVRQFGKCSSDAVWIFTDRFKKMNEKFWALTHPKLPVVFSYFQQIRDESD